MLEKKWNNIAPEVPQDFHNKFEDTLKQIEQADSVDKKYYVSKERLEKIQISNFAQERKMIQDKGGGVFNPAYKGLQRP